MNHLSWLSDLADTLADEGTLWGCILLVASGATLAVGLALAGALPSVGGALVGGAALVGPFAVGLALLAGTAALVAGRWPFWAGHGPAALGLGLLAVALIGFPWRPEALAAPAVGLVTLLALARGRVVRSPMAPALTPLLLACAALGVVAAIGPWAPLAAGAVFLGVWGGPVRAAGS